MKKVSLIGFLLHLLVLHLSGQTSPENQTANYINGIYYYNRLDNMRTSYDRWHTLATDMKWEGTMHDIHSGFYSAMNDFSIGLDVDGNTIAPLLVGYALGGEKFGYYFLLSTTNSRGWVNKNVEKLPDSYSAITVGLNYTFKYFSLMGDFTWSNHDYSLYGKVYFPFLRSHLGVGSSPYDEIIDPVTEQKKMIRSNLNIDQYFVETRILRYANIGLKLFAYTKTRYMPNINMAAHRFFKEEKWGTMKYDAELFFETRGEKLDNLFNMTDYETRLTLYRLIGEPIAEKYGTCVRSALFVGLSYKSPINYFDQTLTESGKVYNGQSGFGVEIGGGLRVLGFQRYGFKEDTYVRISYFYNYSQYFERFPGMEQGLKFKVMM